MIGRSLTNATIPFSSRDFFGLAALGSAGLTLAALVSAEAGVAAEVAGATAGAADVAAGGAVGVEDVGSARLGVSAQSARAVRRPV